MSCDERPTIIVPRARPAGTPNFTRLIRAARNQTPVSRYPRQAHTIADDYDICGSLCGHPIREGNQIVHLDGRPHHLEHFT